jgi:ketosteroid isomerase-like protein
MSRVILLLAALQGSACAASLPPPAPVPPPPDPAVLRASLEKAELDFAASVAARGVDAWVDAFAEDGMELQADGTIVRGHAAIRGMMAPSLAKVKIAWHPVVVQPAPSGDMGFTSGPYEVTVPVEGGAPKVVSHGTFMTVWKRAPDGTWKVAADFGSEDKGKP